MSSKHVANDNFVYIAFPQAPIYLKQDRLRDKTETESRISGELDKYCHGRRSVYLAFPKGEGPADFLDSYIKSAIQTQKLFRQSASLNDLGVAHCLRFSKNGLDSSQQNESKNKFIRGVCIYQEMGSDIKDTNDVASLLHEHDFDIARISLSASDDKQLIWKSCSDDSSEEFTITCVDPSDVASQLKQSCVSPVFTLSTLCPVFNSFDEARNVLKKVLQI